MSDARHHINEAKRVESLRHAMILDTPAEAEFDRLVELAADICETPMAFVCFVDDERCWYKSRLGFDEQEFPRSIALCGQTILAGQPLVVPDTLADERFVDNPMCTAPDGVRAYLGVPVCCPDGQRIGTIGVASASPRPFSPLQQKTLVTLGKQIEQLVRLRTTVTRLRLNNEQLVLRMAALNASTDGIVTVSQDGQLVEVNQAFAEMHGYEHRGDLVNQPWSTVCDLNLAELGLHLDIREPSFYLSRQSELSSRRRDGSRFDSWVTWTYAENNHWIGVFRDVSEWRQHEAVLRASEAHLRMITDAVPAFISYVDTEHRFQFVNAKYEEFFEKPRAELIGQHVRNIIGDETYRQAVPHFEAALQGQPVRCEIRHSDFEGRRLGSEMTLVPHHSNTGQILGMHVVVIDQTEMLRQRDELSRQEKETQRILDSLRAFIVFKDTKNRILRINQYAADAVGLPVEDIEGRHTADVYPADADHYYEDDLKVVQTGKAQFGIIESVQNGDGSTSWIRTDKIPLFDDAGNVERILVVAVDVTELLETQSELVAAREAAEDANYAKSQFLANMSHEIRTPMSAILGFADVLAQSLTEPRQIEAANTIRRNGDHLLNLINDILDLSKIEAGRMTIHSQKFSPQMLVNDVVKSLFWRIESSKVQLRVATEGLIPEWIESDLTRLRQVLINLVGNALKFTSEGSIEVRLRTLPQTSNEQRLLEFAVVDTGIGIAEEHLEWLFQPFTQVDDSSTRQHGGTGLGLAICKRLVNMLGGEISLESQLGKGSTFRFVIPYVEPDTFETTMLHIEDARSESEDPTADSPHLPRVLLAEDGPDNQRLFKFLLEKAGMAVTIANNGSEAIEAIQSGWDQFDLVLMDLEMPVLDGYSATRELRAMGYKKPVIALTAHAMPEVAERCHAIGFSDYATKPIRRPALMELVAKWHRSELPVAH